MFAVFFHTGRLEGFRLSELVHSRPRGVYAGDIQAWEGFRDTCM